MKDKKQSDESKIKIALEYSNNIIATLRESFLVLNKDLKVISVNQAFYDTFEVTEKDTIGRLLPDLGNRQWNIPKLLLLLKEILPEKKIVKDYEVEHRFDQIGQRIMVLNVCQLRVPKKIVKMIEAGIEEEEEEEEEELILMAIEDITKRKQVEINLRERHKELSALYAVAKIIDKGGSIEEMFQEIVDILPLAWVYNEVACARIILNKNEFKTGNFNKTTQCLISDIIVDGKPVGIVELCYLQEQPIMDEGAFLKEERSLINTIAERLGKVAEHKLAEAEVKDSQKLLQKIINLLPIRIFWKDKNLKYLGCNEIFAKDSGKNRPEDLIGKDDFQMGWKEQAKIYQADDQAVIRSGKAKLNFEEPQTTPKGDKIWLKTSKLPLIDSEGNEIGVLGTYEDITERKKKEEEAGWRLYELEVFYKAAVGREERIIELKKEIEDLKNNLRK